MVNCKELSGERRLGLPMPDPRREQKDRLPERKFARVERVTPVQHFRRGSRLPSAAKVALVRLATRRESAQCGHTGGWPNPSCPGGFVQVHVLCMQVARNTRPFSETFHACP
jgi:hypothetical protein